MALSLAQGAQMIASVGYAARVRSAMVRYARTVAAETIGTMGGAEFTKRKTLATRVLSNPDSMVNAFLSAIASDSGASLTWYQPVNIASSTAANPSVVTTATAHGLAPGDVVEISPLHLVNTNIVGVWTLATASGTTFTVPHPGLAAGGATGWVMKHETDVTIAFTLQSAWSNIAGTYAGES